ncbi:MAG: hypothetical protein L6437_14010 [Kiritimatiellae bacterium]|nr:hypothetical protein [Kiritimatiellia bacterium]
MLLVNTVFFGFNIKELLSASEERIFSVAPYAGMTRSSERVKDPDAFKGEACMSDVSKHFIQGIHGPVAGFSLYGEKPGIYIAEFSLKASDNSIDKRVLICDAVEYNGPFVNDPSNSRKINAKEFDSSNIYQKFSVKYRVSGQGFVSLSVRWFGEINVWWDRVTVKFEEAFTNEDLYQMMKLEDKPDELSINQNQFNIFEAQGLFADMWGFKKAVSMINGSKRKVSLFKYHSQWPGVIPEYPDTYEKLFGYNLIILNNVNVIGLKVTGRKQLVDFVESGGMLILLGDTHMLAQGEITETFIENILPVKLSPPRDVVRSDIPLYLKPDSNLSNLNLNWSKKPYTVYYHKVQNVKGDVLLRSGSIPLIIGKRCGSGKIIVILLSVFGESVKDSDGIPFWEWEDWPKLLSEVIQGGVK